MTPTTSAPVSADSLRAELRRIEADHPGWHLWLDSGGRINATRILGAGGVTLDAGCPATITWLIADWEHHWSCALHHMAGAA